MDSGIFIILVVLTIIVLIAIIIIIWVLARNNIKPTSSSEIGGGCESTSDCILGLICDNSKCLIPPNGSCALFPNMCAEGRSCFKGSCSLLTNAPNIIGPNGKSLPPLIRKLPITFNGDNKDSSIPDENDESVPDDIIYNVSPPFSKITFNDGKTTIFEGHIVDASSSETILSQVLNTGVWVITTNSINEQNFETGSIKFINNHEVLSVDINYQPLSCLSLEKNKCYVLCKDSQNVPVLLLINLITLPKQLNISVTKLEFPTIYNNILIDSGDCISLGQTSFNTAMIIMVNGIWMLDTNSNWVWRSMNNNDVLYISFVLGQRLTINYDTFSYFNYSGKWNSPNNFPKIMPNRNIDYVNYWSKGLLELR